jgi:hypothetical protein
MTKKQSVIKKKYEANKRDILKRKSLAEFFGKFPTTPGIRKSATDVKAIEKKQFKENKENQRKALREK